MSFERKIVEEHPEFKVVEVLDPSLGPRRYFAQIGAELVTKGYVTAEAVRIEMEMQSSKRVLSDLGNSEWVAPKPLVAIAPGALLTYPIGRAMLLLFTNGRYPRGRHNRVFVAFFPAIFLSIIFAGLAFIYS